MPIIKSFDVSFNIYHVGCKKASAEKYYPNMIVSANKVHSGRSFVCCTCGEEISVTVRLEE